MKIVLSLLSLFIICACTKHVEQSSYIKDIKHLKANTQCIILKSDNGNAEVCICPEYQGRVITSTTNKEKDISNAWINRSLLNDEYIGNGSDLGGEDRLWIGPLGGQHSFFYGQQKPLSEDNWKVPACMNEEAYTIVSQDNTSILMEKAMSLTNFLGTQLNMLIKRKISLLEKSQVESNLSISLPTIDYVAFESNNTLINTDTVTWNTYTGLATIWSLGMFEGTDKGIVIIPINENVELNEINTYLGTLGDSRLKIKDNCLSFKSDGKYRSKIGIPNIIAPSIFGHYKPETNTLTIVQYRHKKDSLYFNSDVSIQKNPYNGESIQVYNHGSMDYTPVEEASFFELESVAAFKELKPQDSLYHYHRVYHFNAEIDKLNNISLQLLGVNLNEVTL